MINYSDDPLQKLKKQAPFFYELYNLSVFATYIGFIIISWYFINLAYTINTPSYDIFCVGCNLFSHMTNIALMLVWLFFLYFYIISEIRFRFTHYAQTKRDYLIKRNNVLTIIGSLALTTLTFFIII